MFHRPCKKSRLKVPAIGYRIYQGGAHDRDEGGGSRRKGAGEPTEIESFSVSLSAWENITACPRGEGEARVVGGKKKTKKFAMRPPVEGFRTESHGPEIGKGECFWTVGEGVRICI